MPTARLYLDYIDPGSWLMDRRVEAASRVTGTPVERLPWEARRPPEPLIAPDDPAWRRYWAEMSAQADAPEWVPPALVPWTRKAHELALEAREVGAFQGVHQGLFRAFLEDGLDVGRVDVLVEVARRVGLDATRVRVALDVDRQARELDRIRAEGAALGVGGVPTLELDGRRLEGVHEQEVIQAFLAGPEAGREE